MSARLGHVHTDRAVGGRIHRHHCDWITGQTSVGFDPELAGVGSTNCCGDLGATAVPVPAEPTADPCNGYLFQLVKVPVLRDFGIIIRGVRQAIVLRADIENEDGSISPFELEQSSPFWHPPDGRVSFHLLWSQAECGTLVCDPDQQPGTSPNFFCDESALLYTKPYVPGTGMPYVALYGGVPPGDPIADLGAMRDLRYPWDHPDWTLSEIIHGPGVVTLYAVVKQTNPALRPPCLLTAQQLDAVRAEDRFVCAFPFDPAVPGSGARYGRVAGSVIFEMLPLCDRCST